MKIITILMILTLIVAIIGILLAALSDTETFQVIDGIIADKIEERRKNK